MVFCAAFGCSNRLKKGSGISFFKFPKNPVQRSTWEHYCRRSSFTATNHHTLCSVHFSMDMFQYHSSKFESLGLNFSRRAKLKDDALPDIPLMEKENTAYTDRFSSPKTARGAYAKRQKADVLKSAIQEYDQKFLVQELDDLDQELDEADHDMCVLNFNREESLPSSPSVETCTSNVNVSTKSTSAQVNMRPSQRTRRIQVRPQLRPEQVSKGTQCCLITEDTSWRTSDVIDNIFDQEEVDMDVDDSDQSAMSDDQDYNPDLDSDEDDDDDDGNDDYETDMNYVLSGDSDVASEKQFLVSESALHRVLSVCKTCHGMCKTVINYSKGTMISTTSVCPFGHVYEWKSQSCHNSLPWSNLLVSAAVFFSGSSFSKVCQLFNIMNMQMFCRRTFLNIQSAYLVPSTIHVWSANQREMFEQRAGQSLVLGGDGRCDSPGFSAKYGSYSLMDLNTNEVLDVQLVQSNEVKSSTHMELEGLKRGLEQLNEDDIQVDTLVTDRHVMVKKYMREEQSNTKHYFDVWHMAKGVTKKLEGCAKKRDCEAIRPWIKSAGNHMYWTAMTSGSRPHKMLVSVVQSPYLLRDIGKLSPNHQTYGLEVFHNIVNHFASKSNHYFYPSMLARLYLAALHYNENSKNRRAVTKDGQQKWQISYPKAKKGKEVVVKPCKTRPTYGYVALLLQACIDRRMDLQNYTTAIVDGRESFGQIPPPLTDSYQHVNKSELIERHRSRFIARNGVSPGISDATCSPMA
ncbi:uncharacterized protein LOC110454168 isoform X2 [Mizuhopecten yessoensis]|uniref:uncharacterized protein LOC110442654 isoform X2 n=1 Tax=Mizuhopecten yessoensis TaxID=6573 RepID=UPI000B45DC80|nr:uncharacterized protein LOC110442654 isoform X2 [Mizuhopecten yessoensis]XP_021359220.1 uncharacterized protein LOC110454168 isoform X2 [Mizuhopecten yessoensis]